MVFPYSRTKQYFCLLLPGAYIHSNFLLILTCGDCIVPFHPSAICIVLWSHRRCWAPLRRHWPWTGTSARPCCLCWPAVPLCSPAQSTTHSWLTPHCRPSTGCPKAAHSPKPKGTPLRSVCWLSASKACRALFSWVKILKGELEIYRLPHVIFQTMLSFLACLRL